MGKTKSRGNGQGTAYKRKGQSTWTASVVVGWRPPAKEGGHPIPVKRTKAGFATKKEALAYCESLRHAETKRERRTLQQVYDEWSEKYQSRIVSSTMAGYLAAYKHFAPLHARDVASIAAQDLQDCMDACPAGKRTHQQMKVVSGLLWAYAFDKNYLDRDVTKNLYTGKGQSQQRDPLTPEEVQVIRSAIGSEPFADYVYALCYLGFRPGEFLALKKSDLRSENGLFYLIGGSKTEAGTDRRVPVPKAIESIISARLNTVGTDLLFPQYCYNRKHEFTGYKQMRDQYFREAIFKPLMARLGIAEGKVPYCARHTYSDKLKGAAGDDKTKAAIMGHTDYSFTKRRYQSTTLDDIKQVAESIK